MGGFRQFLSSAIMLFSPFHSVIESIKRSSLTFGCWRRRAWEAAAIVAGSVQKERANMSGKFLSENRRKSHAV